MNKPDEPLLIDKRIVLYLPKHTRAYSKAEALIEYACDHLQKKIKSKRFYGKKWKWSVGKVTKFLQELDENNFIFEGHDNEDYTKADYEKPLW